MNTYLLIASVLTIALALAHSVLGELKILRHLKDENLPALQGIPLLFKIKSPAKRTLRFVWHLASVFGFGFAAVLFYFSNLSALTQTDAVVIKIISATMFAAGSVTLIITHASHMGWVLFFAIAVFCAMAV